MTETDRRALLRIARAAIERHVQSLPPDPPDLSGALAHRAGVFVSIHKGDELRGCIGHVESDEVLGILVPRSAVAACSVDPRFPPVEAHELLSLTLEISILGPLEEVAHAREIVVGRDGLLVEEGWSRGLLLPQVAVQWNWDRETFLTHTCQKAGLPNDAWKRGARVWKFEAEVFHE